jgi:hypothetical protein
MSTQCSLSKCSSSNFLPRIPSAFQHASRKALPGVLGRAAMLSQEKYNGFEDGERPLLGGMRPWRADGVSALRRPSWGGCRGGR